MAEQSRKRNYGAKPSSSKDSSFKKTRSRSEDTKEGGKSSFSKYGSKKTGGYRSEGSEDSGRTKKYGSDSKPFEKKSGSFLERKSSDDKPFERSERSFKSEGRGSSGPKKSYGRSAKTESPRGSRSGDSTRKPFPSARSFKSKDDSGEETKRFDKPFKKDYEKSDRPSSFKGGSKSGSYEKKPFSTGRFKDKDPSEGGFKKSDKPFKRDGKRPERTTSDRNERSEKTSYSTDRKDFKLAGKRPGSSNDEFEDFEDNDFSSKKSSFSKEGESSRRPSGKPTTSRSEKDDDGKVRLNKFIANSGICSRREADQLIETGVISVNGKVITELGYKISPTDIIRYGGETIKREKPVYIVINKPKDYITTSEDPQERKTVLHIIGSSCQERVYPVGRLDRNSTGVLLLTNDGELTKKLTHPKYGKKKVYHVVLDKPLKMADMQKIAGGLELEDGPVTVDEINYVDNASSKKEVGIELHSGKNRIIRRIFESLDYKVIKLDRVYFAGLTKKNLSRGQWRYLTEKEISMLKMGTL